MERTWKKKAILFTGWIIILFLGTKSEWTAWTEPEPPEFTLHGLVQTCPTPEALARFLRKQISFQEDLELFGEPDYWQEPEEFLARRAGDCEDYAILTQAVLALQGKESFLLSLYGPQGYAHTICVFIEEGRYHVINEDRVVRYRAKSLEELATLLYPAWRWAAVAKRMGHRGRSVREIQNPSPLPSHAVSSRSSLYSDLLP